MVRYKIGDIVSRKSYNNDIIFKVIDVKEEEDKISYILKGTNFRIIADSPEDDLEQSSEEEFIKQNESVDKRVMDIVKDKDNLFRGEEVRNKKKSKKNIRRFGMAPTVLHLDGDEEYLEICLKAYKSIGLRAFGKVVPEIEQSRLVQEYLNRYKPDILVLTGHDSVVKDCNNFKSLDSYRNSKYFAEAVRKARQFESSYDELVIFAGACQSYYEEIIKAGANYATSPYRILVHALDPVLVCEKIAFTSITKFLSPKEVLQNTITGEKGVGGLETRGQYREGSPPSPYN
ncbi:sporulation-specific protease YabG [Clostridium cylindrosporum DSM 605]|uniref:Sporulation-specific protease YabG n=1 Tax=Clostridium cylindrosporum DSM 605 TaxID=1121307 RepID=A0A0J8DAE9_CLOCY|nr:sporulation-specific protease YabG [Clostridium cylindrosporum DSM 605]